MSLALLRPRGLKDFYLSYPRSRTFKRKKVLLPDGEKSWEVKAKGDSPPKSILLDGSLASNGGKAYFFDMDRGVQVSQAEVEKGWLGIDAVETYKDGHDRRFSVLDGKAQEKILVYLKILMWIVVACVLGIVGVVALMLQQNP